MDCLVVDRLSYERMKLETEQFRARVQELERENDLFRNELQLMKKLCETVEQLRQSQDKCIQCVRQQFRIQETPYDREISVYHTEYASIKSMLAQLGLLNTCHALSAATNGADASVVTADELVLTTTATVDQLWTTATSGATIVVTDAQHLDNPDSYLCADEDLDTSSLADNTSPDVTHVLITTSDVKSAAKRKAQTKRTKTCAVMSGEKKHKCSWSGCQYATDNRGNFQKHYRIHTGEKPYKCQYESCLYSCSDPARFREHKLIHSTEKSYVCEWPGCTWKFKTHKLLKNHIKACHTGDKPHKCEWPGCEKQFLNKYEVRDHMRQHTGDRPFKCEYPECNGAFARSNTLTQHIREVHYYKKQFFCDYSDCDARYDRVDELKTHIRDKHSKQPALNDSQSSSSSSRVIDLNHTSKAVNK